MRVFVAGQEARDTDEFVELALGTPPELWLGVEGESEQERAAREAAARDILAADPDLFGVTTAVMVQVIEAVAPELLDVAVLPRPEAGRRRVRRAGVAA
jgi:hypothetical protein